MPELNELAPSVLRYMQVTSVLAKRAMDELGVKQAEEKKAADLIPATVQLMLDSGLIKATQKEAAALKLASPSGTLQILANAIEKIATMRKTAGDLGRGEDLEKAAADQGTEARPRINANYLGQRTSEKRGSDDAFTRGLGLPVH